MVGRYTRGRRQVDIGINRKITFMVDEALANPGREKAKSFRKKWEKRIAELKGEEVDPQKAETIRDRFRADEVAITTSLPRRGNVGEVVHIIKNTRIELEEVLGTGPPGPRPRTRFERVIEGVREKVTDLLSRR